MAGKPHHSDDSSFMLMEVRLQAIAAALGEITIRLAGIEERIGELEGLTGQALADEAALEEKLRLCLQDQATSQHPTS